MRGLSAMLAMALGGALLVSLPGVLVLRGLRRASILVHICGLVIVAVLSVLAGIVSVAQACSFRRTTATC